MFKKIKSVITFSINKEIKILSLSFLLIFFGFNGVQHYITSFFSNINTIDLGFHILILIYLFFILFAPFSALFVLKYGAKKCMILSSLFYFIFIISLLSKNIIVIYISSSLLGIAASLLWTGQNSYLIRASNAHQYGMNAGFFNSFLSFGSALGVCVLGFFISIFLFDISFLLFSILPIVGFVLLFKLKNYKTKEKINHFENIKKSFTSITALKLSSLWFATNFAYGLVIGIIPLEIKNILGISYIGLLCSLFYILPMFLSYHFGKLSDRKGRKNMIITAYVLLIISLIFLSFSIYPIFLIFGIILLALNWSIMKPISYALIGDVTTKNNLDSLTALFWLIQNVGVISALFLSHIFIANNNLYLISIFIIACSFILLISLFKLDINILRKKISQETQ